MEHELPDRKAPVHLPVRETPNRSVIVFVTVCADKSRALFARVAVHELLVEAWRSADAWRVGRYVLMPNHIHMFCAPTRRDYPSLKRWVQYWKALVSKSWPWADEQPIWQKSFWDTQLRRGERHSEKWAYVRNNPVRAGLCTRPEEWPYQGEMNVFMWHD